MHGYKLISPSTPTVNWTALWHIILVSVAAGCGLALLFGVILLGVHFAERKQAGDAERGGAYALSGVAALACAAIIVAGIYVMTHPEKSKAGKVVPTAALVSSHRAVV
jgi:cytochrome bd-type quinol oxidase subunit 2